MKKSQGFTLIELMIVVAIIAILAAIAIPAYQDYLIRSQVSEGASLADGSKTAVAEFLADAGYYPPTNVSAGLALAADIKGSYVKSVNAAGGVIRVTYSDATPQEANAAITGKVLVFSPISNAGSIQWTCNAAAGTTVLAKYLPNVCR